MGTRETRCQRGRRTGIELVRRLVGDLRQARQSAGVSQRTLAAQLGWSQSEVNRLEQFRFESVSVSRLSEIGSVLGLELSAGFHPAGDPIRDKGHKAVIGRFVMLVTVPPYVVTHEAQFPAAGDLRSWDLLLRLDDLLVGVEVETRLRDLQAFVRRIRRRERDGGVDEILIVLGDTAHNRRLLPDLLESLGDRFATPPRALVAALRAGERLPGSGVIVV